jgi:uncharacterized membrane protein
MTSTTPAVERVRGHCPEQKAANMKFIKPKTYRRLWEIDTIRGIAVVVMVFYHLTFDLYFFDALEGVFPTLPWQVFARAIGSTFILLLGLSFTLRYNRLRSDLGGWPLFQKYLFRGLKILALGMVITAVTYFAVGSQRLVIFGILHLLGAATILAYPFLRSRWACLVGAILVIVVGAYVTSIEIPSPWLLWLGVDQYAYYPVDWYPIFPWFGVALFGAFLGFSLYPGGVRGFDLPRASQGAWSSTVPVRGLSFLGRHSLIIYLVHQPILMGLLILLGIGSI